jgi:hypothetical protein
VTSIGQQNTASTPTTGGFARKKQAETPIFDLPKKPD